MAWRKVQGGETKAEVWDSEDNGRIHTRKRSQSGEEGLCHDPLGCVIAGHSTRHIRRQPLQAVKQRRARGMKGFGRTVVV